MVFCGKCGTKIEDGAKFCPACGAEAQIPGENAQPQGDYGAKLQLSATHPYHFVCIKVRVSCMKSC